MTIVGSAGFDCLNRGRKHKSEEEEARRPQQHLALLMLTSAVPSLLTVDMTLYHLLLYCMSLLVAGAVKLEPLVLP